jgi:glycosyltransferase involved in cell wall biosynthesis
VAVKKEKPRILAILQLPPPIHGAALSNQRFVNGELKTQFNISPIQLSLAKHYKYLGGKIRTKKIVDGFKLLAKTFFNLLSQKIDIVYLTPGESGAPLFRDCIIGILLQLFKKKYILHLRGIGIKKSFQKANSLNKILIKRLFKHAYNVICLSAHLTHDINYLIRTEQLEIVPNGITDESHLAKKVIAPDPIILFLSNLFEEKGPLVLLKSVPLVLKKFPKARFIFAGKWMDDNCQKKFHQFRNSAKIQENVEIVGPIYGKKKTDLLMRASVFVFPSFYPTEAMPRVVLEAMQCGIPIVATRIAAVPDEIVDGVSGFLIAPKDIDGLARRIIEVLQDPQRAMEIGKEARRRYKRYFTINIWEKRMAEILKNAIGDRG